MGERKVLNKYYPPDFDPAKLPRGKRQQNNEMKVCVKRGCAQSAAAALPQCCAALCSAQCVRGCVYSRPSTTQTAHLLPPHAACFGPRLTRMATPPHTHVRTRIVQVRMMLPMSVRCKTCGTFMYKGTKFNTRKEDVEGEEYLGLKVRVCVARVTTLSAPRAPAAGACCSPQPPPAAGVTPCVAPAPLLRPLCDTSPPEPRRSSASTTAAPTAPPSSA
jgi:hypothetical protein